MITDAALTRFVRGGLSVQGLREELHGLVELDYSRAGSRVVHVSAGAGLPTVTFSRADVRCVLDRFLAFQITDEELSDWAATIRLLDSHFDLEPTDPDPDVVWDILDRLAAPSVWGDLTRTGVEEMLLALGDIHGPREHGESP